jgi:hypothetical protein
VTASCPKPNEWYSVPAAGHAQLFFLPVLYKFARQTMRTVVKC